MGNEEADVIINQQPRPRLLVRGFKDQPALRESLLSLAPSSLSIASLGKVRQAEWDILVTDEHLDEVEVRNSANEKHGLFIVYVHTREIYPWAVVDKGDGWQIGAYQGHISQELKRIKGLPVRISDLIREQLEPVLITRKDHHHFQVDPPGGPYGKLSPEGVELPTIEPFISSADGKILAGRYKRGSLPEVWLLPGDVPDLCAWVRVALAEWHSLAPERFPGIPDWAQQPEWMTPSEQALAAALIGLEHEQVEMLARVEARRGRLQQEMNKAKGLADAYERALLTTQHDTLKDAAIRALRELGFAVIDADLKAKPGDHLEDLQVSDPDQPGWIALAEVKGYTKGAATAAFAQFTRFNKRYVQKHGASPDASWYIANQFLGRDPAARQPILHGKKEDVESFADSDGLVIDTVELFKLLRLVQDGTVAAKDARSKLRLATGIFRT